MQSINKFLCLLLVITNSIAQDIIQNNYINNSETINTNHLMNIAVSTINNCQADLNIQVPISIAIQSINTNNDTIQQNIYNRNRYDFLSFHQKLLNNNINIPLLNKSTSFDISNELYRIHFKNALNNNLDLANTILNISLERTNNKKQEMFNNIEIVKNMSIDNKQKLSNYLLNNWRHTIKFLNISINYCQDTYNYLGALHFINNQVISNIHNNIRTIFCSVLDYLKYEKEVLLELGLGI